MIKFPRDDLLRGMILILHESQIGFLSLSLSNLISGKFCQKIRIERKSGGRKPEHERRLFRLQYKRHCVFLIYILLAKFFVSFFALRRENYLFTSASSDQLGNFMN